MMNGRRPDSRSFLEEIVKSRKGPTRPSKSYSNLSVVPGYEPGAELPSTHAYPSISIPRYFPKVKVKDKSKGNIVH
jgi:hypothetical protein